MHLVVPYLKPGSSWLWLNLDKHTVEPKLIQPQGFIQKKIIFWEGKLQIAVGLASINFFWGGGSWGVLEGEAPPTG